MGLVYNEILKNKRYAEPAKLKASEPYSEIRISAGPSAKDLLYRFSVRGVSVERSHIIGTFGHVLCRFPDGRLMYVNPENISEWKIA